jgi:hypothetical protein
MKQNTQVIISYLTMRRLIGVLGISLPFIVVIGGFIEHGFVIQGSISGYYYTNMRDIFIGILCVVFLFLVSYKGYERVDNFVSNVSGICALGMIVFPTGMYSGKVVKVGMFLINDNVSEYIHLAFGSLFFFALAYNSIFLFTKRPPGTLTARKKRRNLIYRICGIIMFIALVCIVIYSVFLRNTILVKYDPVLILESIALVSFGVSWLIKGNTFFKDQLSHKD